MAAVIGAAFVIALQLGAILSYGSMSRIEMLNSDAFVAHAPDVGSPVYADDSDGQTFVWPAQGFVYTLVAAAPPQTVAQVVAALPHNGSPGLLSRVGHGMRRLVSWLIP